LASRIRLRSSYLLIACCGRRVPLAFGAFYEELEFVAGHVTTFD
jgi:hypothetical protein